MLYYLFIEKKTREFLRLGQRDFPDLMKRPFLRCKRIHQIIWNIFANHIYDIVLIKSSIWFFF